MRWAAVALVLLVTSCVTGAGPPPRPRPVIVVSLTSRKDRAAARRDEATVDRARRLLAGRGVPIGRVRFEVLDRSALASVLVELDEAGDPCAAARWRTAVAPLGLDPDALVVLVGGTIRSPVPFARRAGVTCSPDRLSCVPPSRRAGAVILSDRRPVDSVDPAVVLLHEIGHAAGLGHVGEADTCGDGVGDAVIGGDSPANVMQGDLHAAPGRGSTGAVTLEAVTLTPTQTKQIAAYLR